MTKQGFPPIDTADDAMAPSVHPEVDTRTAEERQMAELSLAIAAVAKEITQVRQALEVCMGSFCRLSPLSLFGTSLHVHPNSVMRVARFRAAEPSRGRVYGAGTPWRDSLPTYTHGRLYNMAYFSAFFWLVFYDEPFCVYIYCLYCTAVVCQRWRQRPDASRAEALGRPVWLRCGRTRAYRGSRSCSFGGWGATAADSRLAGSRRTPSSAYTFIHTAVIIESSAADSLFVRVILDQD